MTKKDKGAEWKPPEFDEVELMKKEMRAAKTTIIVVLWTLPSAILSYGLTLAGVAVVAFFAGIGMMLLLKWIMPLLKVDISEYKRKDWIGHGATFFFSWLAFWIRLLNPPFADLTAPTIIGMTVNGTSVPCGGSVASTTSSVELNVTASDNVGVTFASYSIGGEQANPLSRTSEDLWQASFPVPSTPVTISVSDGAGHSFSCQIMITRSP